MALGTAWAVVGVSAILPLGAGTVPQAAAASATTVDGPALWRPVTKDYGPKGKITVSSTTNLSNEVVHVSWEGFTPTVDPMGNPVKFVKLNSPTGQELYPVRVYQCRGTDPTVHDCYGSTKFNQDPAKGFLQPAPPPGTITPDFPFNGAVRVTGPDGRGEADIEVWTAEESPALRCDATHPCSLVVEANYGGDALGFTTDNQKIDCSNHSLDNPIESEYYAMASESIFAMSGAENDTWNPGESCAWANRVVIPLSFAPTAGDCPSTTQDLLVGGLAMANRAMQQWRAGLCRGSNPLGVDYIGNLGEPQTRANFRKQSGPDVALTALPESEPANRPYVYAPLATSAISVAYVVDDAANSGQIKTLNLTPRLLAKMLTQSYAMVKGVTIDSVANNPVCIFEDKDFLDLNQLDPASGQRWPKCTEQAWLADSAPIVLGGTTDLIYQLTSWIAADPEAAAFMRGEPDPNGMHVNTFYQQPTFAGYPVDAIRVQDYSGPDAWKMYEINPLNNGLAQVARNLLMSKPTCQSPFADVDGKHASCASVDPGRRGLFAIMDSGQAKAYGMPEAALRNPAGQFVKPTQDALRAAVATMPVDPASGTQKLPYGVAGTEFASSAQAYPLSVVQYAMVPTGGLSAAKAKAASEFLRRVTDPAEGQVYGNEPGQLTAGFLALTDDQLAQARSAVTHVAAQDGKYPGNQPGPEPTGPEGENGGQTGGNGENGGQTGGNGDNGGTTGGTDGGTTGGGDGGTTGGTTGGTDGGTTGGTTGGTSGGSTGGTTGSTGSTGSTDTGGTTGSTGTTGTTGTTGSTGTSGSTGSGTSGGSGTTGSGSTGSTGSTGTTGTTGSVGGTAAVPAAPAPVPSAAPVKANAAPAATPAATTGPLAAAPVAAGTPAADRSGGARLLLPIALIVGAVLLVGGPLALVLAGTPAGARIAAGASGVWARLRPGRRV
ncbi:hypothetical protein [Kitasatospora purpeofusca]|uniref:hypothetical protein n=1 Tax=Kitasatospora purpeofusca TaxID=67352 RepID=UPI00381B747D